MNPAVCQLKIEKVNKGALYKYTQCTQPSKNIHNVHNPVKIYTMFANLFNQILKANKIDFKG